MGDSSSSYPSFKSCRSATSCKNDARADRAEASREYARLLYDLYPGHSNNEIAKMAAKDLNCSVRTIEYHLSGTTAPGLHLAMRAARQRGVRLIIEPVANSIKLKIEQIKKGQKNG